MRKFEHAGETSFLPRTLPVRWPISLFRCCDPHVNTQLNSTPPRYCPLEWCPSPLLAPLQIDPISCCATPGAYPGYICKSSSASASANPLTTLLPLLLNLPSERSRKNCVRMHETHTLWILHKKFFQNSLFPSYCSNSINIL